MSESRNNDDIRVRLPRELHDAIERRARSQFTSIAAVARQAIFEYLQRHDTYPPDSTGPDTMQDKPKRQ